MIRLSPKVHGVLRALRVKNKKVARGVKDWVERQQLVNFRNPKLPEIPDTD